MYPDTHLRTLRGGGKMDYGYDLRVWQLNSAEPDFYSPSIGFCCGRDSWGYGRLPDCYC